MKATLKHIVFLSPGFPESEKDTTTIPALQDYLIALKKEIPKCRMTIITFQFPFSKKEYLWNGYRIVPLNGKNKRIKKFTTWRKANTLLKQIHIEHPISLLHSFWIGECSYIGTKFSEKNNIKHLVTAMGQDVLKPNKYIDSIKRKNTKVITLSENHSNYLLQNFNTTSFIIPWGINEKKKPKSTEKMIDILGVGSLNEVKNYIDFIEIISEVKKTHPNIKVEIIGEGDKMKEIKNAILNKGLENTIQLIGRISRNEVFSKMEDAKILLHTSTFESFGMVFIEALNAGMSIVSYQVGIAENSNHWRIGNNKEELETLLLEALRTPIEMNSEIDFSIKKTVLNYTKIYSTK